jgi:long-chain acyl-CoA synthetase
VQQRAAAIAGAPITAPAIPATLITTPLFHVSANNCSAYQATYAGGKIVLMYKWDAGAAVRLIEQERITSVRGVPVMSREILHHPDFAKADRSSLISMGGGGAPLPPDLVLRISDCDVIPSTAYGLTETSGIISAVDAAFFADKPTSVGRVMPTFEARIVDDNGADAALGSHGELWVRGAAVFKEYLNRPEATEEALTDGWFHTGDIARIDTEGFLHIVDRKKDMVLRGGENISCAEVEACLYRDDAVAECAVFGVPDERLGEEVGVAVYPVKGVETSAQALRELCLSSMARHKCPRYIWFVDEPLPRNANGKFLKRQIRSALRLQNAQ